MWDRVALCVVLATFMPRFARAQGYPPTEAASRMTVPDGLEVKLFASEPMIRQPVCIEFDDRGRLWVIQYLQYPNPAGLTRVSVDRYSRTVYDKVPPPPPHGPKGADRITILEDTDHDGDADTAKDFVNGLNITSGLAFGHGGVFVLNAPYLLFYPDRNRDDVPDGDPEVLLTGFGLEDAHSVANSLTWGPDGWLYGCQGSTVTANIRGVEFQQGVWRYHPLTKKFELFCEGGGNSWGMDFDPHGNLLYNTNHGGYVMLHAVQGAYYWKSFGKHGPLHNPYAYGYFDHVPHANFQGGHVSVGGVIYHGDNLPEHFRDKFIAPDLLDHSVHWHDMTPDGSSFKSAHGGDLLKANDTWFASSDSTMGPDGAIYVADFHDQRTAHPDPDAEWDRSNGRVYRISGKGKKFDAGPDYSKLSNDQLIEMLSKRDNWVSRKARRELANRRDPQVIEPLRKRLRELGDVETLWALYVSGGFNEELAKQTLTHENPDIRWWTVRFLGDEEKVSAEIAATLAEMAAKDDSVRVRSQLASTAKRLPPEQGLPIVEAILARDIDAKDPHIPLLLWWAVERHAIDARERVLAYFTTRHTRGGIRPRPPGPTPPGWKSKLAREVIVGRLVRRYAAEGDEAGLIACAWLLAAGDLEDETGLMEALDQGLAERPRPSLTVPDALKKQLSRIPDPTAVGTRVFARLGDPRGTETAILTATHDNCPTEERVKMIEILGEFGDSKTPKVLISLLRLTEPEAVRVAALSALGHFNDNEIAEKVIDWYTTFPVTARPRVIDLLIGRPTWAVLMLDAVDSGMIPPGDVTIDQLRRVAEFKDKTLDARIAKRWGKITGGGTPEEKLAEVRRLNNDLRAASGDKAAGKAIYMNTCGVCHKLFNEGGAVGPDLTHANRSDRNYLLVSIVDPSSVIRAEHLSYLVRTTDGRVLSGLLVDQNQANVTLLDAKGERITIERSKVQTLKESPVSLMPEGLLTAMKPQQLRDLFTYLQSPSN